MCPMPTLVIPVRRSPAISGGASSYVARGFGREVPRRRHSARALCLLHGTVLPSSRLGADRREGLSPNEARYLGTNFDFSRWGRETQRFELTRSFNQAALWHLADGVGVCTKNGARSREAQMPTGKTVTFSYFPPCRACVFIFRECQTDLWGDNPCRLTADRARDSMKRPGKNSGL